MTHFLEPLLAGLLRGSVALALASVVVGGACRLLRPRSPRLQWWCWLVALLCGFAWLPLPVRVAWYSVPEPAAEPLRQITIDPRPVEPVPLTIPDEPPSAVAFAEPVTALPTAERPTFDPADLPPLLALVWLLGLVVLLLRSSLGYVWLIRQVRRAEPAPREWSAELARLAGPIGDRSRITALASDRLGPLLCWQPGGYRIVLPKRLWSEWSTDQRTAVLRHELAHWARGDVWFGMLGRLIVLVHWFNPLAWFAARRFEECAEWACDDWAVRDQRGLAPGYAAALLRLCTLPAPRPAGAQTAAGSPAARRIRRILQSQPREESMMKRSILLAGAGCVLAGSLVRIELVAQGPKPQKTQQPNADSQEPTGKVAAQRRKSSFDLAPLPKNLGEREKRLMLVQIDEHLIRAMGYAAARLAREPDDASALGRGMLLLAVLDARGIASQKLAALQELAGRTWKFSLDPPMPERSLAALASEFRKRRDDSMKQTDQLRERYVELSGRPAPNDWQQKERLWLTLARDVIVAAHLEAPETYFRQRMAESPEHADWLRYAYMASVRPDRQKFDFGLVASLVEQDPPADANAADQLASVVLAALLADVGPDHAELDRLLRRLLNWVSSAEAATLARQPQSPPFQTLVRIYQTARSRSTYNRHSMALADAVLRTPGAGLFSTFATQTDMSADERRARSLAKPASVAADNVSLARVVKDLVEEVDLPLWVDAAVLRHDAKVSLQTKGPWLEVVQRVIEPTPFRLLHLQSDLLWIGDPKDRAAAQARLGQTLVRMPASSDAATEALRRPVAVQFHETPLRDGLDFLQECYDVSSVLLLDDPWRPITLEQAGMPGHLTLTSLAEQAKGDWLLANNTIVVGTAEQIEGVRSRIADHQHQQVRLMSLPPGSRVRSAFTKPAMFKFDETPLRDILDFLGDYTQCNFVVARVKDPDVPVTLTMNRVSLSWAFEMIMLRTGLTWYPDGHVVYVGEVAAVADYQKRAESRAARRQGYPAALAQRLQKPLTVNCSDQKLADAVKPIAKLTQLAISVGPEPADLAARRVTLDCHDLPIDVALDLVCELVKGTWEINDKGTIVVRSR